MAWQIGAGIVKELTLFWTELITSGILACSRGTRSLRLLA